MNGACISTFFGPAPGEGSKGQVSLNYNYKVNFKDFILNCVCVFTNERYKTYQIFILTRIMDYFSCSPLNTSFILDKLENDFQKILNTLTRMRNGDDIGDVILRLQ